jgi:hypothetical protein
VTSNSKAPFEIIFSVCLVLIPTFGLFAVGYFLWLLIGEGFPLALTISLSGILLCVAILISKLVRELWKRQP